MNKLDVLHVHRHHVQSPLLPDTPLTPYICIQIRKWFGVTKFIKEPIFFPHFYRIHKNKNCLGILLACVVLPSFFRFLSFKSNSHRFVQHKWLFFTRVIINSMCASVCVCARSWWLWFSEVLCRSYSLLVSFFRFRADIAESGNRFTIPNNNNNKNCYGVSMHKHIFVV